jgi:polysaccharide export outer membrane protein
LASLALLAGCNTLPANGPDTAEVVRASRGSSPAFRIVNLDPQSVLAANDLAPSITSSGGIARLTAFAPFGSVDEIHEGDTLRVTVYEVGASLFAQSTGPAGGSQSGEVSPGAASHTLPDLPVQPDGTISVPYVGPVPAAGRTPEAVANEIQAGLRGQSQSPQVVVSVRDDLGNTVILMGDVKSAGRKLLSYRRERLLDMIAIAGGPSQDSVDTLVRVTRRDISAQMPLADIISGSADDIALEPQDRIALLYRPPSFTALGAAGKVAEVPFHSVRLNLAEAMGRIGGPLDQLADPTGIFIFRSDQIGDRPPVVWRLNLKDPRSYFLAQSFFVRNKDVIFVANARSDSVAKILSLINNVISPVVTARYLSGS